jgi:predicted  nucleic acid-binding Zn-ribbon protein
MCVQTGFPNVLAPQVEAKKSSGPQDKPRTSEFKELKRNLQKAEKTAATAEKSLGELNSKIEVLQAKLAAESDYRKQASIHLEVEQLQNQLAAIETEWLESTEQIELLKTELQGMGRG